jgi:hypothetical protein
MHLKLVYICHKIANFLTKNFKSLVLFLLDFSLNELEFGNNHKQFMKKTFTVTEVDVTSLNTARFLRIAPLTVCARNMKLKLCISKRAQVAYGLLHSRSIYFQDPTTKCQNVLSRSGNELR